MRKGKGTTEAIDEGMRMKSGGRRNQTVDRGRRGNPGNAFQRKGMDKRENTVVKIKL